MKILDRDNIRREKQRRNYEFTSIPGLFSKLQQGCFFIWSKVICEGHTTYVAYASDESFENNPSYAINFSILS